VVSRTSGESRVIIVVGEVRSGMAWRIIQPDETAEVGKLSI